MRVLIALFCFLISASAQFNTVCNTGCVQNATWWKQNTGSWPAGCIVQPGTTFCGTNASTILSSFTGDTLTAPEVLVEYIVGQLNNASGACLVVSSSGALVNLKTDIDKANNGVVPTSYTDDGCSLGYATFSSELNSYFKSKSLGQTLYKYNNGILYGPCPCSNPNCRQIS
jgi:hypothetical protein